MGQSAASLALLLILLGQGAAGPQAIQTTVCKEHTALHSRLDEVEKRVEDTVRKLEVDMVELLEVITAPERNHIPDAGHPVVDFLDEQDKSGTVTK